LYDQGIRDEEDIPDNVNVQNYVNIRQGLGESVVLSDDNGESTAHEINAPESESAPTSSDVMSTSHEAFRKAAAEN
ncbi:6320_t:CDS:1, partial [Paraglomus occultum]